MWVIVRHNAWHEQYFFFFIIFLFFLLFSFLFLVIYVCEICITDVASSQFINTLVSRNEPDNSQNRHLHKRKTDGSTMEFWWTKLLQNLKRQWKLLIQRFKTFIFHLWKLHTLYLQTLAGNDPSALYWKILTVPSTYFITLNHCKLTYVFIY